MNVRAHRCSDCNDDYGKSHEPSPTQGSRLPHSHILHLIIGRVCQRVFWLSPLGSLLSNTFHDVQKAYRRRMSRVFPHEITVLNRIRESRRMVRTFLGLLSDCLDPRFVRILCSIRRHGLLFARMSPGLTPLDASVHYLPICLNGSSCSHICNLPATSSSPSLA